MKQLALISMFSKGGRLLDIGCGTGNFLKVVKHYFPQWTPYGIDINQNNIKFCKQNVNAVFKLSSIEKIIFSDKYFSVVTCIDIIEHVNDFNKALKEISRVLSNNGILFIQAPNYISLMRYFCGNQWDWWLIPDHRYHFSTKSLSLLLIKNNFDIIKCETINDKNIFIKNTVSKLSKQLKYRFFEKFIRYTFTLLLNIFYPLIDYISIKNNMGGLINIYARKI
jgi:2-polyprenyl-3-methyl-5-hydroxy-6-metoxy-1,4-benzoquinol methylase